MNNKRREEIKKAILSIELITKKVMGILSEEEYCYDSMSEGFQSSQIGIDSEEAQDNLQSAIDSLEEASQYLEEIP